MGSKIQDLLTELQNKSQSFILGRTLIIFIPIILVVAVNAIIILFLQEKLELQISQASERSNTETKLNNVRAELSDVISEMLILKFDSHVAGLHESPDSQTIEDISNEIFNVVKYQRTFDQIRLIDKNGNEIIRVNYKNGNPEIVPKDQLQNKKNRYYFTESLKLKSNEIYISPFDLNIEKKQIEIPVKPMIRFCSPLFDQNNELIAILVFNYLGQRILDQIKMNYNSEKDYQIMLLNNESYWLKGPRPEMEWGFMYDDKQNVKFSSIFPNEWEIISKRDSLQFETENGLFTFKTIYPISKEFSNEFNISVFNDTTNKNKRIWKLVSFVPNDILYSYQNKRRKVVFFGLIIFAVGILFISWKIAVYQYRIRLSLLSLQISNQTKDKLFTVVAHDLKGPFNALLGFSESLIGEIEKGNTSKIKTYSYILKDTINNTYNFLINLLDWSQSQTNKIEYKPEKLNLYLLVNEILELLDLQIRKKNISLLNKIPENQIIAADKNIINTVLRNFISNAIKYTHQKGTIEIISSTENNKLKCSVIDNGVGMSEEAIAELISFGDINSTSGTENEKGTGLGLMLCNELIKKHKGEIGIQSKAGKGSTFFFEIPQP